MQLRTWHIAIATLALWIAMTAAVRAQAQTNAPVVIPDAPADAAPPATPTDPPPQRADQIEPPLANPTTEQTAPRSATPAATPPDRRGNEQLPLGRTPDGDSVPDDRRDTSSASWIVETFSALVIVIALILLVRLAMRRMSGQGGANEVGGLVEVLARCPIAPKTHVVFLKIQQRIIIAAQSPSGLDTLADIDDPQEVAQLLAATDAAKDNSISHSFRNLMSRMDRAYRHPRETADEGADQSEYTVDRASEQVSGLLGRLRRMNSGKD